MHEFAIASAVTDAVLRHAAGRRVTSVQLRVGRLRQVVPDSLVFSFGIVTRETVCEGARLDVEVVAARLRCAPCAREWGVEVPAFRCPSCGGSDVTVVSGEQLEVESIEVEEDVACIA